MAEQLVNEFTVNRPIDEAWAVITDVERIAPCLPGAQLQEIEGDVYRGIVKIKLGSITPQFKGQAQFVERDDPSHRAVLKAEGRDTGGRGNASAHIAAQAESLSPTSTKVTVTTDLAITGKVAQFGRGIIGDVSKKLMAQFATNLNTMLDENPPTDGAGASTAPTASPAASAPTKKAAAKKSAAAQQATTDDTDATTRTPTPGTAAGDGDAAPGDRATTDDATEPAGVSGSAASAIPEVPRVRKIDSPAAQPVDLAGVAGPALLKRLGPIAVVLVVLIFLLRRRRS